jgi:hypothetical protein
MARSSRLTENEIPMKSARRIDTFLADYPESIRETAQAARRLLRSALPDANETLDESAKLIGYGYGDGYKGIICTLIMSQTGVKLGFSRGSELPDPKHLLTGAGKVHRHVQLRSEADVAQPGLNRLLKGSLAAWRARNADAS